MPRSTYALALLLAAGPACRPAARPPPGEVYDVGPMVVAQGRELDHTFRVVNTTGVPVWIVEKSHTCTCTASTLEDDRLEPGEATTVRLLVDLPESYSRQDISCFLKTDLPGSPTWTYTLRFSTVPRVWVEPTALYLGNRIDPEAEPGSLRSVATVDRFLSERVATPDPPAIEAPPGVLLAVDDAPEVGPIGNGLKQVRHRVTARFDPAAPPQPGRHSGVARLTWPDGEQATVVVVWKQEAAVETNPPSLHFGLVAPGAAVDPRPVTVRSVDGQHFRILGVDPGPGVELAAASGDGASAESHEITLAYRAPADPASPLASGRVLIRTDLAEHPELELPWSAFVRRPPTTDPGADNSAAQTEGTP